MENVEQHPNIDPSLIFVHIPKTAGRTLCHIITRHYEEPLTCWSNKTPLTDISQFSEERKRQIKLFYGHMPFGAHQLLPQPCRYFTLLRDPVERVISHYAFILRSPTHARYPVVKAASSIREYVSCGLHLQADNGQVRILSGVGREIPFGECAREHLELAKRNLRDYFLVVGTSERFDETVLILSQLMGWATPYYPRLNVSRNRLKQESLSAVELDAIRRFNILDTELYHYANELLDAQVKAQGEVFGKELRDFQRVNAEKYVEINQTVNPVTTLEPEVEASQASLSTPDQAISEIEQLRLELAQTQEQLSKLQLKVELLERQQSTSLAALSRAIRLLSEFNLSELRRWAVRFEKLKNRWSGSYRQLGQFEVENDGTEP
ncbi:MAG: sulfotransferase family 2 domain-containing protein [Synechococcales bacterium]|nr:sulfotransferase family 2 domain-containing protein [Synechococcales bacterium]